MKIAVPIQDNEQITSHFGSSDSFMIYEITPNKEIDDKEFLETNTGGSCGCSSGVGPILSGIGVSIVLAGEVAAGVFEALEYAGIKTIRGCSGNSSQTVKDYIDGKIIDNPKANGHHPVAPGHSCSN